MNFNRKFTHGFVLNTCLGLLLLTLTSCFGERYQSFSFVVQNDSDTRISVEAREVIEILPKESKEVYEYGFIVGALAESNCNKPDYLGSLPLVSKIIINDTFEISRDHESWKLTTCNPSLEVATYIYK